MTHDSDVVTHIDQPRLFVPMSCAACTKCWRYVHERRCVHKGPFAGYQQQKETKA